MERASSVVGYRSSANGNPTSSLAALGTFGCWRAFQVVATRRAAASREAALAAPAEHPPDVARDHHERQEHTPDQRRSAVEPLFAGQACRDHAAGCRVLIEARPDRIARPLTRERSRHRMDKRDAFLPMPIAHVDVEKPRKEKDGDGEEVSLE